MNSEASPVTRQEKSSILAQRERGSSGRRRALKSHSVRCGCPDPQVAAGAELQDLAPLRMAKAWLVNGQSIVN